MLGKVCRVSSYPWFTIEPPFDIIVVVVREQSLEDPSLPECLLIGADTTAYYVSKPGTTTPIKRELLRPF